MEKTYYDEMKNNIDNLIKYSQLKKKTIFIFGHCNASEKMVDYLMDNGIEVTAILDNNQSKLGMEYREIAVDNPTIVQSFDASTSIVLIAARAYENMTEQLRRLGYVGSIFKVVDYNSFSEYSLSEDTFIKKKERMLRGNATLTKIKRRFPLQHIVICPYNALGDVYQALSFLPAYISKHGIKDYVILVVGNTCKQVAELFEVKNLIVLDRVTMDELVQAILFIREKNCIIAHHDRPYTSDIIRYLNRSCLSFIDFYKCGIYGLAMDVNPTLPTGNKEYIDVGQIEIGKTVILSPYAKSMVQLPDKYWEALVAEYQQMGYFVCTNIAGNEKPIKGTKLLTIPINQMVSAVEQAGIFIGIRSGLCDIISNARCRKVLIFPDCFYSTTNIKVDKFFDMQGWEKIIYNL